MAAAARKFLPVLCFNIAALMEYTAAWNSTSRMCLLCRSLEEANGEAEKKRRTSRKCPTFDSEELERVLVIHVITQLIGESLDARRSTNETFTGFEWRALSSTWAGATQRAIPRCEARSCVANRTADVKRERLMHSACFYPRRRMLCGPNCPISVDARKVDTAPLTLQ